MEKETIIRSAAIAVAGIMASAYGAHYFLGGNTDAPDMAQSSIQSDQSEVVSASVLGNLQAPKPESVELTALSTGASQGVSLEAGMDFAPRLALVEDAPQAGDASSCAPIMALSPVLDGLIELSLTATCHPETRLVVSHGDLAFSGFTSENGTYTTYLPALSTQAAVDVFLGDDIYLQERVYVEDVDDHFRIVLQWTGAADFGLHAYHNGANFGEAGHLHALQPFDAALDAAFLISLGDRRGPEPMLAEVYSIPAAQSNLSRLELELRFESAQCGQEVTAYILKAGAGAVSDMEAASFALPDCPTVPGTTIMALPFDLTQHAQRWGRDAVMLSGLSD